MKNRKDLFYAKILLFGEYSVIYNSMGLSIPYTHFKGELSFINQDKYTDYDFAVQSNRLIREYFPYLSEKLSKENSVLSFDLQRLEEDIEKGLYFESTIPLGYGLGSSGALVAALYERYTDQKINTESVTEITKLKNEFAELESFFHGKSSGLDPLNSYIKHPLLIKNQNHIEPVGLPRKRFNGNGAIFLLDTGRVGKTAPLVKKFVDKIENTKYGQILKENLIDLNNSAIKNLVKGELKRFYAVLKKLSRFQLELFNEMIPSDFHDLWEQGFKSGNYYLKLCGSGGGGFLLGFTHDYEKAKEIFKRNGLEPITVYRNEEEKLKV